MTDQTTSPPPAYFLSLSLENVRSFGEKQTISFARPDGRPAQWTIILGDNGVGKTTVLKALAGMRPSPLPASYEEKTKSYSPIFFKLSYANLLLSRVNSALAYIRVSTRFNAGLDEYPSKGKITIRDNFVTYNTDNDGTYLGGAVVSLFEEQELSLICYGYGAGRTIGNSTLSEAPEGVDTCISLFNDRADLLNPEEWFLQMEYSSLKQDKQAAKSLEQVRQVLLKVLPDVTDIRISSKSHQQYLELETPYGWVRLRDMSLGYQTLVVWLTDFASKLFIRYPDSPNPLEEPAIVLIDEIDLHLHPSWQRKLLKFLSDIFVNTQFIATAHSPLVVQAAGDMGANVVLLKREDDQTIVHQNPEDVRGWRVDQILNSELFEDTSTLSVQTEDELALRNKLLLKKRLTTKDKTQLAELNAQVAAQPIGDTPAERKVESLLARLAQNLKPGDLLE
ncbi:AAA family ATPase [Hymenobacter artigasi]|uniref:Energy-coupling factor transporter ATP-binding protein EcfA2 n=1 Tax=Hymenobacter artigasi TaxID=2719616 RepID=A0ABX1HKH2_9BACT|nr:AAA family ATPase [Hymenobacter artigasi]NKI90389.1 energy-coupling factor transporter ATP-binding protein EcfA2 [Hymenobacter artigasi]